uniref:Ig-like domain-containing protein n=1 Tax=Poecilia latipinna TaxID=48699 RepID=A0A3B3VCA5_9TELE
MNAILLVYNIKSACKASIQCIYNLHIEALDTWVRYAGRQHGEIKLSGLLFLNLLGEINCKNVSFTFSFIYHKNKCITIFSFTLTVESALGRPVCSSGYCITLSDGEITAEAGLCVVIPCFFTVADGFTPKAIVWFKCEPGRRRCGDSDVVFHTNRNKVPSEFLGRVLLLDPDVSQGNCSIMINDLSTSDSGSYQLRVNGFYQGMVDGVTFPSRTSLSATLTCTAPGLCSGSPPKITWMWRRKGEMEANITGNMAASFKTENLTVVTQRHSSILTFNSSAKHHNTNVTCKVSFTNKSQPQITGNTIVKEGDDLNLTCNVESFPQSVVVWTKHSASEIYLQNNTGSATLVISNVTAADSGRYVCTATHLNETVSAYADVKLTSSEMSKDPKDVQYASIDFSVMKQRRAKEAAKERASTLTEYAEIKTGPKEQSKDGNTEGSETLEGEEEDLMTKHDEETKHCVSEEQTEVEAVYSTVKDVLDEI